MYNFQYYIHWREGELKFVDFYTETKDLYIGWSVPLYLKILYDLKVRFRLYFEDDQIKIGLDVDFRQLEFCL